MKQPVLLLLRGLCLSLFFAANTSYAIESTEVLPSGIRSVGVQMGTIGGLNQQYTNSGELKYLSDLNSTQLDARTLRQLEPSVNDLIQVLNSFGHHQIGEQINLGRLYVDADPEIKYYAPVALYGATDRLTFGVAVPVLHYSNKVQIGHAGSNLSLLRSEVGGLIPEIDAAFNQLDRDMKQEFRNALRAKGYKDLSNVNKEFIGDVQFIMAYRMPSAARFRHATRLYTTFPTGPKADPDDLTDIETLGRWGLQGQWITEYEIGKHVNVLGVASYQSVLPQKTDKRVPLNGEDSLPDKSQTMRLNEDIGDSWSLTGGVAWNATRAVTHSAAYTLEEKMADDYEGAPAGRDRYLEARTHREAHLAKYEFAYSTVAEFKANKFPIPGDIKYQLTQVLSGTNVENQTRHDVYIKMYF